MQPPSFVPMRAISSPHLLALIVVIATLGCSGGERRDELVRNPPAESAAAPTPAPWYRRARMLDLTGDRQADSVRVDAFGPRSDSLRITLSIVVDGEVKHREGWSSSYELALLDSAARVHPSVDAFLRAQLDTVLASVIVQRLDAPGVRLMAEDSAVLARLEPRPTHRVSFSYGYETTVRLVWDAPRERFVRLWSCC